MGAWLVLVLLFAGSALYVAAEFAAVGVRHSQLRALAAENRAAARLLAVVGHPRRLDDYIAASQVGITVANLVLGAFSQAAITPSVVAWADRRWPASGVHEVAPVVVLLVMTTAMLVLGEVAPKFWALGHPLRVALLTAPLMRWSLVVFRPLIWALNGVALALLRLCGVREGRRHHVHSPEEIALLLVESRDGGLLEPDEQERLHRALQLGELTARQLMVPRLYLECLDVATPPDEVLARVQASRFTRLPVYRDHPDDVLGLLHSQDVVAQVAERGSLGPIEPLVRPLPAISEHVGADRILRLLREHRSEQALVVDEYGGVAGLITVHDLLAEVLSEVPDTVLGGQPEPGRLADGRVRLPGLLRLDEAEEWLGMRWEGEAETVGGRVAEALGRLPAEGETLEIDGLAVEVERVARQAVMSLLVRPRPAATGADDG